MSNYFANIESSDGQRDVNDQYETPHSITEALCNHVVFHPTVFEPACGTGRVVRALAAEGYAVTAKDIQTGNDFLEVLKWHGSIVTNPPYHKGLAEAFIRHALSLTDQPCAFLVRTGFLNSQRRCRLFHEHPRRRYCMSPHASSSSKLTGLASLDRHTITAGWCGTSPSDVHPYG